MGYYNFFAYIFMGYYKNLVKPIVQYVGYQNKSKFILLYL